MNVKACQREDRSRPGASGTDTARWTMARWLACIEDIERGRGIRLGLERIAGVWRRLGSPRPAPRIVTVAGTNGKGSVVHLLYESLHAHGVRVGRYTSPHLRLFNERIAFLGRLSEDRECVRAFRRVHAACAHEGISYFEYITLSAFVMMESAGLDLAILEVGLGGRYDAVNLLDTDLAIITSIGMDHCNFLGCDPSAIAREKCGIMRAHKPALCAIEPTTQAQAIIDVCESESRSCGATLLRAGRDWRWRAGAAGRWHYCSDRYSLDLPVPASCGLTGLDNAAVAVRALEYLLPEGIDCRRLSSVYARHSLAGRFQFSVRHPHILFDTAHNVPALARLLARVRAEDRTVESILLNARRDKDLPGMLEQCALEISVWHCVDFGEDFYSAREIRDCLARLMDTGGIPRATIACHASLDETVAVVSAPCRRPRAVRLVCGSFVVLDRLMSVLDEPVCAPQEISPSL